MPSSQRDVPRTSRRGVSRRATAPLVLLAMLMALAAAPPAAAQVAEPDAAAQRTAAQRMAAQPWASVAADATTGTISGLATAPTGFLASSWQAWAIDPESGDVVAAARVSADGTYLLTVPAGSYVMLFVGPGYRIWPDVYEDAEGERVVVAPGGAVTGVDMALTLGTALTAPGHVEVASGRTQDPTHVEFTVTTPGISRDPTGEVVLRRESGAVVARTALRADQGGRGVLVLPTVLAVGDAQRLTMEYSGNEIFDRSTAPITMDVTAVPELPAPVRLLDTSTPGTACVDLDGVVRVPRGATGVMLNVTASAPSGPGYGIVYADTAGDGSTRPPAGSTVNFEVGADVANWALVDLPANGRICYGTGGAPDARKIVDLMGYAYDDMGLTSTPATRLLDTRPGGLGELQGPVAPRTVTTVQVAGRAGVPADAAAVLLNVTVTGPTTAGNLRVFPGGGPVPNTSVVNYAPGADKANATLVQLVDGKVSFWSDSPVSAGESPVQVVLDVVGYTSSTSRLSSMTPTRINDSRPESRIGNQLGRLGQRVPHVIPIVPLGPGPFPVPEGATAVLLNVTAVSAPAAGNLRVYPPSGDRGVPVVSTLNYIDGRDVANLVMVPVTHDGGAYLYSDSDFGGPFFTADVVGYLTGP